MFRLFRPANPPRDLMQASLTQLAAHHDVVRLVLMLAHAGHAAGWAELTEIYPEATETVVRPLMQAAIQGSLASLNDPADRTLRQWVVFGAFSDTVGRMCNGEPPLSPTAWRLFTSAARLYAMQHRIGLDLS